MKEKFVVRTAVLAIGIFIVSATPGFAALTVTLSDGNPLDDRIFKDSGSPGSIFASGTVIGNWSFKQLSGFFGSDPLDPLLELNYSLTAASGNTTALTLTLTETGFGPLPSSTGDLLLAIGGTAGTSAVTQNGLINGSIVGTQGPFGGTSFDGNKHMTVTDLGGNSFSISEQLVFTGTGHNGGDAILDLAGVVIPEPGTALAGAFAGLYGLGFFVRRTLKNRAP